jgi:hypothetical protein
MPWAVRDEFVLWWNNWRKRYEEGQERRRQRRLEARQRQHEVENDQHPWGRKTTVVPAIEGHLMGRLSGAGTLGAAELIRLTKGAKSEGVRLAAARAVLEMALKVRDAVAVADEIAELRKSVAELKASNGNPRAN